MTLNTKIKHDQPSSLGTRIAIYRGGERIGSIDPGVESGVSLWAGNGKVELVEVFTFTIDGNEYESVTSDMLVTSIYGLTGRTPYYQLHKNGVPVLSTSTTVVGAAFTLEEPPHAPATVES
jgi:hypothetical protein